MDSGVPPRIAGYRLADFVPESEGSAAALGAAAEWATKADHGDAWLVLCGPLGSGKTHLAIGACRALKLETPRSHLAYELVPDLISKIKEYLNEKREDPRYRLAAAPIVVLDSVDPRQQPEWFRRELEAVLRERFVQCRSTLITTTRNVEEIANAYPSLANAGLNEKTLSPRAKLKKPA
jgi:DNA replication protein DnaC